MSLPHSSLVIAAGGRVALSGSPTQPELAGRLNKIQIKTLNDLAAKQIVNSPSSLPAMLESARNATKKAMHSGKTSPDQQRFKDFVGGAPQASWADKSLFWGVFSRIEPKAALTWELGKALPFPYALNLYHFDDITIEGKGTLQVESTVNALRCRNLVIKKNGVLRSGATQLTVKAYRLQGGSAAPTPGAPAPAANYNIDTSGARGTDGPPAPVTPNGGKGSAGRDAVCGAWDDPPTRGGRGGDGGDGVDGTSGTGGGNAGSITIEVVEYAGGIRYNARGGDGGRGADGADGGAGGDGGPGGWGGGCEPNAYGGNGGDGGDGGNGGDGANGGNGGDFRLYYEQDKTVGTDLPSGSVEGGKGGVGGRGGRGGASGRAGVTGRGKESSYVTTGYDVGQPPVDGRAGEPGTPGASGNSGKSGNVEIKQVTPTAPTGVTSGAGVVQQVM